MTTVVPGRLSSLRKALDLPVIFCRILREGFQSILQVVNMNAALLFLCDSF